MKKNNKFTVFEKILILVFSILMTDFLMRLIEPLVENIWLERGIGILIVAIISSISLMLIKKGKTKDGD